MSKSLFIAVLIALPLPTLALAQIPRAISVEPMAVPPGKTSTVVVHGTSLKDSTSLWSNLGARFSRLNGSGNSPTAIASVFNANGKPPSGTVILEAEDYDRGTWGKRPPFILNIGGGNVNVAEWDVNVAQAGHFVLEMNYASGGERPVKLSVNGIELTEQAARTQTGGFGIGDSKWVPECVLELRKGSNTIRMEKQGGTPHFDKLALVPTKLAPTKFVSVQPTDRLAPFEVTVPAHTPIGIRGIRVATAKGISNLLLFMVDDLPTVQEVSGRTASQRGQRLTQPVAVEGSCDSTHADRFQIEARAGEKLSIEAVASRLGTSLDPIVRLFDESGIELDFEDDTPGLAGDCCIRHKFARTGDYFITIEDSQCRGSSSYRYRLRIGDFPLITSPIPAAVKVGMPRAIRFAGLAVDSITAQHDSVNNSEKLLPISASFSKNSGSGFTQLAVSPHAQHVVTPNSAETVIPIPGGVSGVFTEAAELHRFQIEVKKGQRIQLSDRSRSRGVPTIVAMAIRDLAGKELAAVRRAGVAGQTLTWTAGADGRFEVVLSELTRRAGSEFGYHVELDEARPDFDLAVEKDNSILPQNGYAILKVTANRRGYNGPIELSVKGLGVSPKLSNATIPEKTKDARLKIYVPSGLAPGSTRGIEIIGTPVGRPQIRKTAKTIAAFRKAMPQATFAPPGLNGLVALSIGPEIPDFFGLSVDGGEIVFPRLVGEVYFTVRVRNRSKGFKDMVNISVQGLPKGFTAGGGDRAVSRSDNNEYRFQLRGPTKAEHSTGHVRIVGEATFKGQTKEFELSNVRFRVIDPLIISLTPDKPIQSGRKGRLQISARRFVPRAGGDKAEISIEFTSIPKGVTLPKSARIAAGKSSTSIEFLVAGDANLASPIQVTARTVVAKESVEVKTSVRLSSVRRSK